MSTKISAAICAECGEVIIYVGGWTHGDARSHDARPETGGSES